MTRKSSKLHKNLRVIFFTNMLHLNYFRIKHQCLWLMKKRVLLAWPKNGKISKKEFASKIHLNVILSRTGQSQSPINIAAPFEFENKDSQINLNYNERSDAIPRLRRDFSTGMIFIQGSWGSVSYAG
jgi:carbonic anhydrase